MWLLKLHFSISVLCFLMYMGFRTVFKDKIKENGHLQDRSKKKLSSWLFFIIPVLNILLVITLFLMIVLKKSDLEEKCQEPSEPYVEKYTECDICAYRSECQNGGNLVEITGGRDIHRHFIKSLGCYCRKETDFMGSKKLTELLEMTHELNPIERDKANELILKALDKFGDITYEELMRDKFYEL